MKLGRKRGKIQQQKNDGEAALGALSRSYECSRVGSSYVTIKILHMHRDRHINSHGRS
jgi:hypothetical protein